MISFISVIEALLIVTALSMDALVSGFAYGSNKIKIPFSSVTVINFVCSAILALSLFFGSVVRLFIPAFLTTAICFGILFILGLIKLFDSAIKIFIRKNAELNKKIKFSIFNLGFILNIYANPQEADSDLSKLLSPSEAAYLAVALSLDGLAAGFGAGLTSVNPVLVVALSLISNMAGVMFGCYLGNKIAQKFSLDLSWLSGVMLIVFAFLKLF